MTECALHLVHHPTVTVTHPVTIGRERVWLCGTGLDNLRVCVAYLGGGASPSARVGRETWDLAQKVVNARKVSGL